MAISVQEAIAFIRSSGGLYNWTDVGIHHAIHQSVRDFSLVYSKDSAGKLSGICFGKWNSKTSYHATYCAGRFLHFINHLRENFPNVTEVTAVRHGKFKTFQLDRL